MEAAATFWASAFLGAALVPIVHFYGRKELGHILASAKPRVFITAEEFGRLLEVDDYPRTASGKVQKRLVRSGIAVTSL